MKIIKRDDLISLNDNLKITVSQAINYLSKYPISFIEKHYLNKEIKLSIKYYQKMLKILMADQVSYFQVMETTLANPMSHRLHNYQDFAVFQLENLLPKLANLENDLINEYYEDIWLVLLQVSNELDISDETLKQWIFEAVDLTIAKHDLNEFMGVMNELFKDHNDMISGLEVDDFKNNVATNATDKEIREFAKKFNIELPKNLVKQEIYDLILNALNNKYPEKQEKNIEILKDLTIIELKRIAKNEKLDVNYEINKNSTVERFIAEYPFKDNRIVKENQINLPPRIKNNLYGQINNDNLTNKDSFVYKEQVVNEIGSKPSKVVYSNSGEPIHIHIYYDGVETGQVINDRRITNNFIKKDEKIVFEKDEYDKTVSKGFPLWLIILILLLLLIIGTILIVVFLDATSLLPHDQSGFTKFVYRLVFGR